MLKDVPPEILSQVNKLEDMFIISREKLKEITDHFVKELEKGVARINLSLQSQQWRKETDRGFN
jgi:hexokinase